MGVFVRQTEKTEYSGEYIGPGDYLRHSTSSIIGTPDVIYGVWYKCGPDHAGREGKVREKKPKEGKKGDHPKEMKDKSDVYNYINHAEVL